MSDDSNGGDYHQNNRVENSKHTVSHTAVAEIPTQLIAPRIVFALDGYVNSQWGKLSQTNMNEITAKLIALQHSPEVYASYDIDLLTGLNQESMVNGGSRTVIGNASSISTPFILHDQDTQYHVAAFFDDAGLCHILSIWPFNEFDRNGQAYNRKPESVMSKIQSLYEALRY